MLLHGQQSETEFLRLTIFHINDTFKTPSPHPGLDMTLKFPFRDLSLVKAGYDFTPEKNDSNMLMFKSGDVRKTIFKTDSDE